MSHNSFIMILDQVSKPLEMSILGCSASVNDFIQIISHVSFTFPLKCFRKHFPNKISSEQQFVLFQQFVIALQENAETLEPLFNK